MRVGAFARGLLLRGECSVELVLMTTNKPVSNLFHTLAGRIPAKFEVSFSARTRGQSQRAGWVVASESRVGGNLREQGGWESQSRVVASESRVGGSL